MKSPLFRKPAPDSTNRKNERGVTMALVALAMVAIIAMAALSIDVVTLYLARQEAQRAANSAALAAANVLSLSGLTGDPANSTSNWASICGPDNGTNGLATRVAKAVASQDLVGGLAANTINVTYSAQSGGTIGAGTTDCTTLALSSFGINPIVTVQLTRSSLPSFFSRIWGNPGNQVSASATAEAFNPSNSSTVVTAGTTIPVKPRCVKPWVVANWNPLNPGGCTTNCNSWVSTSTGQITNPGISLNGGSAAGIIGENFWLTPGCFYGTSGFCDPRRSPRNPPPYPPPQANWVGIGPPIVKNPNLLYLPGQVGTAVSALPAACGGDDYQDAIAGCDQPQNYSCGLPPASSGNVVDLTINPVADTVAGVQCLTHQTDTSNFSSSSGQDTLSPFGQPSAYPFQILAGSGNVSGVPAGTSINTSSSIVSLPIYDQVTTPTLNSGQTSVGFIGFLEVFINAVDQYGNINVTVLNLAGCSNNAAGAPVTGSSPVPVRLITPP
jgi:Flp pilus assembly protein TadG